MTAFLHHNLPDSLILEIGFLKLHWYGLLIAIAILVCLFILSKLARFRQIALDQIFDLSFYLIIFGFIGARLWHILFYNLSYFINQPLAVFKVWQGGLAIHGAILAGLITVYLYAKKQKLSFWLLADLLAVVLPLGQAIGRWGNYFNQELYGKACSFSWCIPIFGEAGYFHPVFLYESILSLILFISLLLVLRLGQLKVGMITVIYLGGYSLIRFFMEFLRLDIAGSWFWGLNWQQILSLAVMMLAVQLVLRLGLSKNR